MVNEESIHDHARQQSVIINPRAIKLQEQSDREYISEYGCASVQYFLHNYTHRCFQSSHAQCSSWPTSCATSTSRRRQGLACDPAPAQCPPWSAAWGVFFCNLNGIWRSWLFLKENCCIMSNMPWLVEKGYCYVLKNTSSSIWSHVKDLKNLSRWNISWLGNHSIPNQKNWHNPLTIL